MQKIFLGYLIIQFPFSIFPLIFCSKSKDIFSISFNFSIILSFIDAETLLIEIINKIIKSEGKASTSFLQRKLQIGYNRAARIIDMMESEGIVSKANHVGKRDVL